MSADAEQTIDTAPTEQELRDKGVRIETEYIRADALVVDPSVQRPLRPARVNQLRKNWDPLLVGVVHVSRRPDGSRIVLDGQYRQAALLLMSRDDHLLCCRVYTGLDKTDEGRLFRGLNNAKAVLPIEKFHVRVTEGDPTALGIKRVATKWGLRIANNTGDRGAVIRGVVTPERIYAKFGETGWDFVLGAAIEAWGSKESSVRDAILRAIALVYESNRLRLNRDHLVRVLQRNWGTAASLYSQGDHIRHATGRPGDSVAMYARDLIVREYNKRLSGVRRLSI